MRSSQAAHALNRVVNLTSRTINSVGAGILVAMMFLTAMDVLLRYVFNRPIEGSLELTEYMMVIVVAFGLAYCAVLKGHVRVEVVTSRFSPRAQAVISSIMYFLSFGFFALITRQSIVYLKFMADAEMTSSVLLIPVFPFVGTLALASATLSLVLLRDFLDFLSQVVRK